MGKRGPAKTPGSKRWKPPEPIAGLPDPPPTLGELATKEWYRIGGILQSRGLISAEDWTALLLYCDNLQRYFDAKAIMDKEGMIVTTERQSYQHAANKIMNQCGQQLLSLFSRLGLSPADRLKGPDVKEDDGKSKFFRTVG